MQVALHAVSMPSHFLDPFPATLQPSNAAVAGVREAQSCSFLVDVSVG